ncbi:MAG: ABC transporter substrate-binding protein [Clostridia bacterium]
MKKAIVFLMVMCLTLGLFAGCGNSQKTIGIIKYGNHSSLNDCLEGVEKGLKEGGITSDEYKIEVLDSNFDSATSATQANSLKNKNVAMIGAIATPSAIAAASVAKGKIPVIYCAVSDPYAVGLTELDNVAGSCDILDFNGQLEIIKGVVPNVKKVGVLYCINEGNSLSQLETLTKVAKTKGIEIVPQSITANNEIVSATNALVGKNVDAITNLTDNTVVGVLTEVLKITNEKKIPIFGSEIDQVKGYEITVNGEKQKVGCVASASLDYVELGRKTGLLMAKVLKGEKITKGEVIKVEDSFFCYSSEFAKQLGLEIPQTYVVDGVTKTMKDVA